MNLLLFLAFSAVGMGLWASLLEMLGARLGEHYDLVGKYLGPVSSAVFVWVARAIRARRGQRE